MPWTYWLTQAATYACLGIWSLLMIFCFAGSIIILKRHRTLPTLAPIPSTSPGVTVLRPLKGVDCNLVHNLVSSFQTRYPTFELIFCVASESDPAVEVVRDLICKYPEVDARLFVGDVQAGVNPKINNMLRGYEDAKYDIVWVLDSNVFVNPDCMGRSVAALLKPGIGLVHHLPCGVDPHTDGSRLEQAFLNTAHAKMYSTINKVGIASCLIGKSNMFRRSVLAKLGGLANFGKYMSEDNIMGEAIWALGLRHAMTVDVAFQTLGSLSSSDYFQRRARWIRIRKYTVTAATLFEPFTESIVNGLLGGWALSRLGYVDVGPFLAAHFIIWVLSDWIIATTLDPSTRRSKLQFWKAWFVREVSALPLWIMAMAGSTVEWRGKLFWLNSDGTVALAVSTQSGQSFLRSLLARAGWSRRRRSSLSSPTPSSKHNSPSSPSSKPLGKLSELGGNQFSPPQVERSSCASDVDPLLVVIPERPSALA